MKVDGLKKSHEVRGQGVKDSQASNTLVRQSSSDSSVEG